MKDINKVILVGRLGANPIQRHTKTGTPVTHFSVATTRKYSKEDSQSSGEAQLIEDTQWHKVFTWGKLAEACSSYLKKGSTVYVEGFIRSRTYDDKEGQKKLIFEIQAEIVSFIGGDPRKESVREPHKGTLIGTMEESIETTEPHDALEPF